MLPVLAVMLLLVVLCRGGGLGGHRLVGHLLLLLLGLPTYLASSFTFKLLEALD